jgi:hypothetical protein
MSSSIRHGYETEELIAADRKAAEKRSQGMQARLIRYESPVEDIIIRVPMIFEKALLVIHEGQYYIFRETADGGEALNQELVNVYVHVPQGQIWEESKTGRGQQ